MASQFLNVKQVSERVGIAVSTIWLWARTDRFPKPVKMGSCTRWRLADIEAWEEAL